MLRIIRGRCKGKTYDLIKYAIKNDCAVVCMTHPQKTRIEGIAKNHFGKEVKVYTITDWAQDGKYKHERYVVDEMELVMRYMLSGGELMGWNMSIE